MVRAIPIAPDRACSRILPSSPPRVRPAGFPPMRIEWDPLCGLSAELIVRGRVMSFSCGSSSASWSSDTSVSANRRAPSTEWSGNRASRGSVRAGRPSASREQSARPRPV